MSGEFFGAGSAAAPESALAGEPGAGGDDFNWLAYSNGWNLPAMALAFWTHSQLDDSGRIFFKSREVASNFIMRLYSRDTDAFIICLTALQFDGAALKVSSMLPIPPIPDVKILVPDGFLDRFCIAIFGLSDINQLKKDHKTRGKEFLLRSSFASGDSGWFDLASEYKKAKKVEEAEAIFERIKIKLSEKRGAGARPLDEDSIDLLKSFNGTQRDAALAAIATRALTGAGAGAGASVAPPLPSLEMTQFSKVVCAALNRLIQVKERPDVPKEDLFFLQKDDPLVVGTRSPFAQHGRERLSLLLKSSAISFLCPIFSWKVSMHKKKYAEFNFNNFVTDEAVSFSDTIARLNRLVDEGTVLMRLSPHGSSEGIADLAGSYRC